MKCRFNCDSLINEQNQFLLKINDTFIMSRIVLKSPAYTNYKKYLEKNKFKETAPTLIMDIQDKHMSLNTFKNIMRNLAYSNNQTVIVSTVIEIPQKDLVNIAYEFVSKQHTATMLSISVKSITNIISIELDQNDVPDRVSSAFHIKYGIYKYDICQEKNRLVVTHLLNRLTWSEKQQFKLLDKQYHFSNEIDDCLLDDILDIKSRY